MHHLNEQALAFIMMLVFSRCTVSLNIKAQYIWSTPYHWPVFMLKNYNRI